MITAWRLCQAKWSATALDGEGAARFPGRWNGVGTKMVYLAESRALAALEILAHVEDPLVLRDAAWIAMSLSFEESLLEKPGRFPEDWRATPAPRSTQLLGSRWVREARSPLMRVPSALVLGEFNYLLNPLHAAVKQIKVGSPEPFLFDARLAKQVLR